MNNNDTTLIPGNDSSALAGKLQRIAGHERGLKTIPRVIQSAGRTRAFAAFYRRFGPRADPWLFRKTGGRAALRLGLPELLLTTTGAKSGLPRVMPLIYVRDGDDFMVVGTNFGQRRHPGWTANLSPTRTPPSRWDPSGCRWQASWPTRRRGSACGRDSWRSTPATRTT